MIEEKYKDLAESAFTMVEGIKRTGIKVVGMQDGYVECVMPLEGNINHVGIMYAGSLFTLGEVIGGIMWGLMFDTKKYYPIVKEITIKFKKPAATDISLEREFSEEEAARIQETAEKEGKADYELTLELKDNSGQTVSIVEGIWQIRKIPEELKGMLTV
jgi:acyl-coenzyme A thioesterase PaaI-like protein